MGVFSLFCRTKLLKNTHFVSVRGSECILLTFFLCFVHCHNHMWLLQQLILKKSYPLFRSLNSRADTDHSKSIRYYKFCFYPLCMYRSYNYPWSSDWSKGLSPKEKIIWMYPGNVSNLFLFNKHLVFCFESWEISILLLDVSQEKSHQNFQKCQICRILKSVSRLA